MTPADVSWAQSLRSHGLTTEQIAKLLAVSAAAVRKVAPGKHVPDCATRYGSTFVNGRGWV